ncbi:MAG: glycosyltransferase family 87 protein [Thermoguttaceae bacterium]
MVAAATIGCAVVLLAVNFIGQRNGLTPFGPQLGADYPAFYTAGHILNTTPQRLYDLELQDRLFHKLIPGAPADQLLFYPSAPFLAVLFRPLALLPYAWSYFGWLVIGVGLALAGFLLLKRSTPELASDWPTVVLAGCSFTPLLVEGWIGGQTSALVLFCVSLAIYLQQRGRSRWAGVAMAALAFKPTLLLLFVPMLLATRAWRVLQGMALGGLVFAGVSVCAVGGEGCRRFLEFLAKYAEVRQRAPESLHPWKYVDLRSAAYPIFYHPAGWAVALMAVLALVAALLLWRTWRRSTDWRVAWATAMVWTPVLSPHFAIYDTVLLIPAAVLLTPSCRETPWFFRGLTILYLVAWFSQPISAAVGVQCLSLAVAWFGWQCCTAGELSATRS